MQALAATYKGTNIVNKYFDDLRLNSARAKCARGVYLN
jgi:hypothetical protein